MTGFSKNLSRSWSQKFISSTHEDQVDPPHVHAKQRTSWPEQPHHVPMGYLFVELDTVQTPSFQCQNGFKRSILHETTRWYL